MADTKAKVRSSEKVVVTLDLDSRAKAEIEVVTDAVCAELGLQSRIDKRRRIADGIARTWQHGLRHPLQLVTAGLNAAHC
jgi:hypothetical protein